MRKILVLTYLLIMMQLINITPSYAIYDALTDIQDKVTLVSKEAEIINEKYSKIMTGINQNKTGLMGVINDGRKAFEDAKKQYDKANSKIGEVKAAVNKANEFKNEQLAKAQSLKEEGQSYYQKLTPNTTAHKFGGSDDENKKTNSEAEVADKKARYQEIMDELAEDSKMANEEDITKEELKKDAIESALERQMLNEAAKVENASPMKERAAFRLDEKQTIQTLEVSNENK